MKSITQVWSKVVKLGFCAIAALLAASGLQSQAAEGRPNFLFIYTDDQRYDALSVVQREQGDKGRYPWFQTPNLDRIAAEGMRFRNAFVTLPLCAPSRAAFLTGRYNHLNGIANNRTPFPTNSVTHATLLREAGYATAYIGKWHMGGQTGQRPGFDYSASFVGQGRYFDCPIEINGKSTETKGWVDDVSTDYAIAYLKTNKTKPFSLVLGFKTCHGPFSPPERAQTRFEGAQARPVPNLGVRAIYREAAPEEPEPSKKGQKGGGTNLGYFRCLSAMDDNVGRLLATLDELGLTTNTVVIFSSDNGYYHGEHGLGDKRSLYEESIRIPLLMRYPGVVPKGKTCDEMVLNIDLAPTLLEMAGVAVPKEMQGRSWVPLYKGNTSGWRKAFLAEYFLEQNFPTTPTVTAVRTPEAKLIKYPGHPEWTELFDLGKDPFETNNLFRADSAKDLLTRMEQTYEKESKAVAFNLPNYADKPGPEAAGNTGGKKRKKKQ